MDEAPEQAVGDEERIEDLFDQSAHVMAIVMARDTQVNNTMKMLNPTFFPNLTMMLSSGWIGRTELLSLLMSFVVYKFRTNVLIIFKLDQLF